MGKDRIEKVIMKVIKKRYPTLEVLGMYWVPTNRLSDDGEWVPHRYCFFIDIKYHVSYRPSDIEDFVGAVSGQEVIINVA